MALSKYEGLLEKRIYQCDFQMSNPPSASVDMTENYEKEHGELNGELNPNNLPYLLYTLKGQEMDFVWPFSDDRTFSVAMENLIDYICLCLPDDGEGRIYLSPKVKYQRHSIFFTENYFGNYRNIAIVGEYSKRADEKPYLRSFLGARKWIDSAVSAGPKAPMSFEELVKSLGGDA